MARSFTTAVREPFDAEWDALLVNPFVAAMADGSLPPENFRFYIEQNLFYLPQYAKVLGFGVARSSDPAQLQRFARSLRQIVDVEVSTNEGLRDRIIELGAADCGAGTEPMPACDGYVNFLLATAATGNALDIMTAILPCAWSYREIAVQYPDPAPHPVYRDWLGFFGSDDYGAYIAGVLDELDQIVGDVGDDDLDRLRATFRSGLRYERAFWDMAHGMQRWPDHRSGSGE